MKEKSEEVRSPAQSANENEAKHNAENTLISPEQDSHSDSEQDSDSQKSHNVSTIT